MGPKPFVFIWVHMNTFIKDLYNYVSMKKIKKSTRLTHSQKGQNIAVLKLNDNKKKIKRREEIIKKLLFKKSINMTTLFMYLCITICDGNSK